MTFKQFLERNIDWLKELHDRLSDNEWYGGLRITVTKGKITGIKWWETEKRNK